MKYPRSGISLGVVAALALGGLAGCDGSANDATKKEQVVGTEPSPKSQQDYMNMMKGSGPGAKKGSAPAADPAPEAEKSP